MFARDRLARRLQAVLGFISDLSGLILQVGHVLALRSWLDPIAGVVQIAQPTGKIAILFDWRHDATQSEWRDSTMNVIVASPLEDGARPLKTHGCAEAEFRKVPSNDFTEASSR